MHTLMKKTLASLSILILLITAMSASAQTGQQGPYLYTYPGDPNGVSTQIINPGIGYQIINPVTGQSYFKLSPKGDNSSYGARDFVISGSITLLSGSATATGALTFGVQPTVGDIIVIGATTYSYVTTISATNQIVIGASTTATATNTSGAITTGGSSAAAYWTGGTNASAFSTSAANVVSLTAWVTGTAGNVATTGTFASPYNSFGATTLTGGLAASGTNVICTLPANAGKFVFTGADIVFSNGTTITAGPTVKIQSGTSTAISASVALTGTAAGTSTVLGRTTVAQVIDTGTTGVTINAVTTVSGTNANFYAKPVLRGYYVP